MSRRARKSRPPEALQAVPTAVTVDPVSLRVYSVPCAAQANPKAEGSRRLTPGHIDEQDDPLALDMQPPPAPIPVLAPLPMPPAPDPAPAELPGQVVIASDYDCGLCERPLVDMDEDDTFVGLRCTEPITHVFHRSCLDQWRANPLTDLAVVCPECKVDPRTAYVHRTATKVAKARIKAKRASCWRLFWAEWARQRSVVIFIMLTVAMVLVVVHVLQEWVRSWSTGTGTDSNPDAAELNPYFDDSVDEL